jgi:hypothetical protein
MHPVLNATDLQTTGDAAVTLTLGDFKAVLTAGDLSTEELPFTDDDGDGTFEADFHFLAPGNYTITVSGPSGVTFATDPASADVTVGSSGGASAAFTLTGASAE